MSQQLYSSDKFIQIKFPDGHKHQILYQQDIRNLKLKICCMNHILFFENQQKYLLIVLQYLIQPSSKSLMFKNLREIGHQYEVIDLRKYFRAQKERQESYEKVLSQIKQQSSNEIEFFKQKIDSLNTLISQISHQQNSTDLEWKQKYQQLFIENQQLMDKIQAQATYVDQLNVKVYEQKQELQDKDSEILICNINLEDCQQSNERLIESLQGTKEELKSYEIELTKLTNQIQQFYAQNQQLQQHIAHQQQQFSKEQQSQNQKIIELEENSNTLQVQLKKEKSYRNQLQSDFDAKAEELNLLNIQQTEKKNAEIKEKVAQIQSLKNKLIESESYFQQILQEHQNQISSLNQSIQYYKQKLDKAQNEVQQLKAISQGTGQTLPKQIVVPGDDTIKKLNDQLEKFQDINDDLKLQIQTLEHTKVQLEQKLTQMGSESQLMDQKFKILFRKNEDLLATIEQKEKEINLAKQDLIQLEQQHKQKLKEIVDQNQKDVSQLNQKIKTIQQQLDSKNQELQQFQTNLNEQIKKLTEQLTNNKNEIKIRDDKIIKLNQQFNGTIHFKWRIDRLVENMYDTKVYIGSNKENLSIEKFLMENQPINTKETIEIKFQVLKINLEVNQLKQKIYQDSNLDFTNCFNFVPQGEIEGLRTKIRTTESNVDRIYFYQCKNGIFKDKVLVIREYIKMPQNMDQEIQHMIKQGGASPVSQFLMEEFYQLIHESKERIEYYNQLSGQKLLIPEKFQFQEQFLLKQHDDARNIDRYYNAWVFNVEQKNNRYDFNRLNGGHKFVNNSDIATFLQVFSFFTIWRTNRQLAVTYIQGIENQLFDPIVSTYDGFFNILDQGNLEIKTFESLFRSSKNNYKAEQLLKCLNINL